MSIRAGEPRYLYSLVCVGMCSNVYTSEYILLFHNVHQCVHTNVYFLDSMCRQWCIGVVAVWVIEQQPLCGRCCVPTGVNPFISRQTIICVPVPLISFHIYQLLFDSLSLYYACTAGSVLCAPEAIVPITRTCTETHTAPHTWTATYIHTAQFSQSSPVFTIQSAQCSVRE